MKHEVVALLCLAGATVAGGPPSLPQVVNNATTASVLAPSYETDGQTLRIEGVTFVSIAVTPDPAEWELAGLGHYRSIGDTPRTIEQDLAPGRYEVEMYGVANGSLERPRRKVSLVIPDPDPAPEPIPGDLTGPDGEPDGVVSVLDLAKAAEQWRAVLQNIGNDGSDD